MCRTLSICFIVFTFLFNSVTANEKKINLIWQIQKERFFEVDWIKEILEKVDYNEIIDGDYQIVKNNSIVVICLDNNKLYKDYFAKFNQNKFKYGIIHVSDELYGHPTDCYKKAKFVLRHYWHKKFKKKKNVYSFPLGYSTGFWANVESKDVKASSDRNYIWSFAGQITHKPTREAMINQMKKVPNFYIYETFAWADVNSLSKEDYRNIMLDSIFIPCPTGWWNLESFRVYEALEAGCIPIVEKKPFNYFARLLRDYPFPAVSSWEEAPDVINKLLADPERLEKLRAKCHRWWLKHKTKIKKETASLCKRKLS